MPMHCTLKEYRQEALTGGRYSNQCTGALHLPALRMVSRIVRPNSDVL